MKTFKQYFNESTKEKPVKRIIDDDGDGTKTEEWRLPSNNQLHREDEPAFIRYDENGNVETEAWFLNGQHHREDEPATIWYDEYGNVKSEEWWINDGYHREDGPAIIEYDKDSNTQCKTWYVNDKIHREDGPAYVFYNGEEAWFLNDDEVTKEEVMRRYPQNFRKSQMMDKLI